MDDYKTLYYELFNKLTDIITELENLQQDAEEAYIEHSSIQPEKAKSKLLAFEGRTSSKAKRKFNNQRFLPMRSL
ncbi:MAG TPA: hypothetical protein PKX46_02790 [Clostridia bacterium]|nr:hypothetical protein [Clostridia bacterium]